MVQKCFGRDYRSGAPSQVLFSRVIEGVDELIHPPEQELPWLAPGFIDLQVNGFAGVDYCAPGASLEDLERSLAVQFSTGVTRLFPTVITGSRETMCGALEMLARAKRELPHGEAFEAFHVEGPFLSPEAGPRGAHPAEHMRPYDLGLWREMQKAAEGNIRLLTISPEYPGVGAFVAEIVSEGVVVAIGHTKASSEQIAEAVQAGASMSTHLGNGCHAVLPRHPNYLWDQLAEDRLTASFIADGIHVPASFLQAAIRAKGIERSVLVSDAVMPAGCPPGQYQLGDVAVMLHEGGRRVTLLDGKQLAGSALRMNDGVGNLMSLLGMSLLDAVSMATRNAARAGRIGGRMRGLNPGERADLVEFRLDNETKRVSIERTWLSGQLVYAQN